MDLLTSDNDECIAKIRMDRNCFLRLCWMLREVGGLRGEKYVTLYEHVTIFLKILAHHDTNRDMGINWRRSGQTVSKYFRKTLDTLLRCSSLLLVTPKAISEENDNVYEPWSHFKGCLGALDGTIVDGTVPIDMQIKCRSRKGRIQVNVLGVCDTEMQFVYLLCGWEGSAADGRVLCDAIHRPTPNGLKVLIGNYYLVDAGYANCEGFLAPYHGRRYHLKEWGEGCGVPQDHKELFKMKHARARNIIERAFAKLKNRLKILKRQSQYHLKIQNRCIMAAALLNNFIKAQMHVYPLETELPDSDDEAGDNRHAEPPTNFVEQMQNTDEIALQMWNKIRAKHRRMH